jgi:hypothetical protein
MKNRHSRGGIPARPLIPARALREKLGTTSQALATLVMI